MFFWSSCEIFSKFFVKFSQVFDLSSTPSTTKKISGRPGARDPSAVKVSAPYDAWRLKKRRKTETKKNANFERTFTRRGCLRLAWEFGKTRFRWFPSFDFSTLEKKIGDIFFIKKFSAGKFTTIYHYFTTIYHYFTIIYHYLPLFYIQQRLKNIP